MKKETIEVERTEQITVPMGISYLLVDGKWRPIHEFSDEVLNVVAESWRKNLLLAAERGRIRAAGLPLPSEENVAW